LCLIGTAMTHCHRTGDSVLFLLYVRPKPAKTTLRLKSRRSRRIDLNVSVLVHRPPKEGPQFYESTKTLVVNAHGALLALKGMVAPKQRLFLQNTSQRGTTRVPRGRRESRTDGHRRRLQWNSRDPHRASGALRFRPRIGIQRLGQQVLARHVGHCENAWHWVAGPPY